MSQWSEVTGNEGRERTGGQIILEVWRRIKVFGHKKVGTLFIEFDQGIEINIFILKKELFVCS